MERTGSDAIGVASSAGAFLGVALAGVGEVVPLQDEEPGVVLPDDRSEGRVRTLPVPQHLHQGAEATGDQVSVRIGLGRGPAFGSALRHVDQDQLRSAGARNGGGEGQEAPRLLGTRSAHHDGGRWLCGGLGGISGGSGHEASTGRRGKQRGRLPRAGPCHLRDVPDL